MKYFRNLHKQYLLISIISIGLLGRAFVASGFMLNTDLSSGDLITVTLCHGPNSINQPSGLDNSSDDNPANDNEQNYCNLWTSSATSLVLINLITIDEEYYVDNQLLNYYNVLTIPAIKSSKLVRGPPV
ncbi:MAG: hypothetical protein CMF54_01190 [Legionellales bacterium]|nr:hypothetical protein [Legionellales bacterium]